MPDLDSEALDFRAASELFAPMRKLNRTNLDTLRLLTTHKGAMQLWNGLTVNTAILRPRSPKHSTCITRS